MFLCLTFLCRSTLVVHLTIFTIPHPLSVSYFHSLHCLLGARLCLSVWLAFLCNKLQHFDSTLGVLLGGRELFLSTYLLVRKKTKKKTKTNKTNTTTMKEFQGPKTKCMHTERYVHKQKTDIGRSCLRSVSLPTSSIVLMVHQIFVNLMLKYMKTKKIFLNAPCINL